MEISKKFRKIIVGDAISSEKEIRFYFDDKRHSYVKGRWNNSSIYMKIEYPNNKKINNIKNNSTFKKIDIKELLLKFLLSISSIFLFVLLCNIYNYYFDNLSLACILALLFIFLLFFAGNLFIHLLTEGLFTSLSVKSNHSAEHMIINFIEKHQRLPINMQELQRTSRFNPFCGSVFYFIEKQQPYFRVPIILNLVLTLYILFIKDPYFLLIKLIVILLIIACVFIFIKKKSYFQTKLNFLIQLSSTTSNVSEESLILAYVVAREWILHRYPEYTNEHWMQHSNILDNCKILRIQDS